MHIGVVGTGTMAQGIAGLCMLRGHLTTVSGRSVRSTARFRDELARWLDRQEAKGRLTTAEARAAQDRLSVAEGIGALGTVDYVIEAIVEDLDAKRSVFSQLERVCRPNATLASNSSSIPVREIARGMSSGQRCIGVHFMNPASAMRLVEVAPACDTSPEVLDQTLRFLESLGKDPIVVPDSPGFVVNRILFSSLQQAMDLLEKGDVDVATIDKAIKLGANHPMGPLELADFIGLDVCLAIFRTLQAAGILPLPPPDILISLVESGRLGRKSGEGFHSYAGR